MGTASAQVELEPSVKDAMNTIDAYGDPLAFKVRKGRESVPDGQHVWRYRYHRDATLSDRAA